MENTQLKCECDHDFQTESFLSPQYCAFCSDLLWGIAKQGVKCTHCHMILHHNCVTSSLKIDQSETDTTIFEEDEKNISLMTASKTFILFIHHVGDIFFIFDSVYDILTWKKTSTSLLSFLCCIFIGAWPMMFLFLPLIFLILWIKPSLSFENQKNHNIQQIQLYMKKYLIFHQIISYYRSKVQSLSYNFKMKLIFLYIGLTFVLFFLNIIHLFFVMTQFLYLMIIVFLFVYYSPFFTFSMTYINWILSLIFQKVSHFYPNFFHHVRIYFSSEIIVQENERWWAGFSWRKTNQLAIDPPGFTDKYGDKLDITQVSDVKPFNGYEWGDHPWQIQISYLTDDQGWTYYNNYWVFQTQSPQPKTNSFTRRRYWKRMCYWQMDNNNISNSNSVDSSCHAKND